MQKIIITCDRCETEMTFQQCFQITIKREQACVAFYEVCGPCCRVATEALKKVEQPHAG